MNSFCKILISYHKQDFLLKDEILTPIHAGRAKALESGAGTSLDWLLNNTIGDDTGDNISKKNTSYNEMTSIYWAWKNYEALGNPDWVGFMHYRRHFRFCGGEKSCYENEGIYPEYLDEIGYSPENLRKLLADADFLSVKPQWRESLYEHYRRNHKIEDLDTVIRILKQKYPEYAEAADGYLSGKKAYFCNMFIFPRETFFRYASWMFDILFAFEEQTDLSEKRLFVSEWLTGIFIHKLILEGKRGVFVPTIYAEGERVIPVVMAADENYAIPLSVTIASLLCNAKPKTKYDIYLLVPDEFSSASKGLLLRYEQIYPGCRINFIVMKDAFNDVHLSIAHISKVTYYRLLIPTLLPQYSKCIYLDGDLVVTGDLTDFFRTNVDDFYLAGVKAAGYMYPAWKVAFETDRLNIPSIENYINAGVLVMNLDKIRKHGLQETFIELSKKPPQSQDQDVLNLACYNNIKILPPRFNLMNKYIQRVNGKYGFNECATYVYSAKELTEALENPLIIHFADRKKPWTDPDGLLCEYWWNYVPHSTFYFKLFDRKILQLDCKIQQLNEMNVKYQAVLHANAQLKESNLRLKTMNQQYKHKLLATRRELVGVKGSLSFRIGRIITYIPRKIRGIIRCSREHGIGYTIKRILMRIFRKAK